MLRKCPAHRHWNVPIEFDNEEVIDDSCEPSFGGEKRAETKSHWLRSQQSQGGGAAGVVGIATALEELVGRGRESYSWEAG